MSGQDTLYAASSRSLGKQERKSKDKRRKTVSFFVVCSIRIYLVVALHFVAVLPLSILAVWPRIPALTMFVAAVSGSLLVWLMS
jgi:hypothetical protein